MNVNEAGIRLGEIYARTLFELAGESEMIDTVKYNLDALTAVSDEEKDFERLIVSPYFSSEHKGLLIRKIFAGVLAELTMDFLMVVIRHNRAIFLPQIIAKYNELWEAYHNCRIVEVTVPKSMNDSEFQRLSADIAAALNSKVRLEVAVNPAIIGGTIIRYGENIIDNTVKTRLQKVVKSITSQRRQEKINEV